ncbi:MAG: recombinase family protein [Planctomycetes bacterium]|nr:recombinase family protein [Planctomycetota bacterium]
MAKKSESTAVYLRSNPENRSISLEQAEKKLISHLNSHGIQNIQVYRDTTFKKSMKTSRKGIFSLLDDIATKKISELWLYSIQDIIFDGELGKQILRELVDSKIETFSLNESQDTMKRLTYQIITTSAAARKSNTTKLKSLEKGKAPAGRAPFGYKRVKTKGESTTKLIVDEKESEVIKKIFNDYLTHKSMAKVAESLSKAKIPAPAGSNWSRASVAWILGNDIYIGIVKYANKKHKGEHKALIDEKTFEEVQKLRTKNRRASVRKTTKKSYSFDNDLAEVSFSKLADAIDIEDKLIDADDNGGITKTMTPNELRDRFNEDKK